MKRGRLRVLAAGLWFAVLMSSALIFPAFAEPVACESVTDERLKAAIAEARQQATKVWRPVGAVLVTAYRLGGAQPVPLGLSKLPAFQGVAPPPGATEVIEGMLAVQAIDCTVHEAGPPTGYIVRLIGRGLTFREGGLAWTPPLPRGIVHGFELVRKNDEFGVRAAPDVRLALPPDARLSLPPDTVRVPPTPKGRDKPLAGR